MARHRLKLVPCTSAAGLKQLRALAEVSPEIVASEVNAALEEADDQQVAGPFNS